MDLLGLGYGSDDDSGSEQQAPAASIRPVTAAPEAPVAPVAGPSRPAPQRTPPGLADDELGLPSSSGGPRLLGKLPAPKTKRVIQYQPPINRAALAANSDSDGDDKPAVKRAKAAAGGQKSKLMDFLPAPKHGDARSGKPSLPDNFFSKGGAADSDDDDGTGGLGRPVPGSLRAADEGDAPGAHGAHAAAAAGGNGANEAYRADAGAAASTSYTQEEHAAAWAAYYAAGGGAGHAGHDAAQHEQQHAQHAQHAAPQQQQQQRKQAPPQQDLLAEALAAVSGGAGVVGGHGGSRGRAGRGPRAGMAGAARTRGVGVGGKWGTDVLAPLSLAAAQLSPPKPSRPHPHPHQQEAERAARVFRVLTLNGKRKKTQTLKT
jgi:hypothetical protein